MFCIGKDLKDPLFATPFLLAGTLSSRVDCSKPHPTSPSTTFPGMGHP